MYMYVCLYMCVHVCVVGKEEENEQVDSYVVEVCVHVLCVQGRP